MDVVCLHADGAMQLQPYATPMAATCWAWIQAQILTHLAGIDADAGTANGAFGSEVHATVPAALAAGHPARPQPIRHLGLDGPGWFLYAAITGPAATNPERAAALDDTLAGITVHPVDAAPAARVTPIPIRPRHTSPRWPPPGLLQLWLRDHDLPFPGAPRRLYLHTPHHR